jgi:hypothetical protein
MMEFIMLDTGSTSWTYKGLLGTSVYSIVYSGTTVYLGTNFGVFVSVDTGANWSSVNNGLAR